MGDIKGFFTFDLFDAYKDVLVDEAYLTDPRSGMGIFIKVWGDDYGTSLLL